tara:strand:+ start:393 stop:623 length:231 start_codon:yes stop_codon:yes gene_type:complete
MVPMMEFRGDNEPMKPPQFPSNIGVEEEAQNQLSHGERSCQLKRESSRDQKEERWGKNGTIQRMGTKATRPIKMFS